MAPTWVRRHAPLLAVLGLALTSAAAIGSIAVESSNGAATDNDGGWSALPFVLVLLAIPAVGALLAARRPTSPVGWLALAAPLCISVALLAHAWAVHALRVSQPHEAGGATSAWLATWLFAFGLGLVPFLLATFPAGSAAPWLRWPLRLGAVALVLVSAAQAIAPDELDGVNASVPPISNPLGVEALRSAVSAVTGAGAAILLGLFLLALGSLVVRAVRGDPRERRQLRWLVLSLIALPAGAAISSLVSAVTSEAQGDVLLSASQLVAIVGASVSLALGVLVGGMFDLKAYAQRLGLGALLSALVLIGFVATVSIVATLTSASGAAPPAVAAAVVALALGPLRGRLQRGIDRLLYGWRSEPFRVLTDLGVRLDESPDPEAALPAVVETVASGLRVPYARIELDSPDGPLTVAVAGTPVPHTERFPLKDGERHLGELVVGRRSAEEAFQPAEVALLHNLARSAGSAANAALMTSELRRARTRLIRSREDERRRLQRELHDGVGPALAGLGLQLDSALDCATSDPAETVVLLAAMQTSLRATAQEVRRIAHDLRPGVLDELGLVEAVREQARFLTASSARPLALTLDLSSAGEVPAAVQVAVYRIASEALTNVVRHAQATTCSVRLLVNGQVELDVADDGVGCRAPADDEGFGVSSRRARATELGGTLLLAARQPTGTLVQLRLPGAP